METVCHLFIHPSILDIKYIKNEKAKQNKKRREEKTYTERKKVIKYHALIYTWIVLSVFVCHLVV